MCNYYDFACIEIIVMSLIIFLQAIVLCVVMLLFHWDVMLLTMG